jgi:NAD(P)-dependent dehydrogenase (short-subunit alcohol dehydrogenase family)
MSGNDPDHTAASRGIGLAIAKSLVDRGDRVLITGRLGEPADVAGAVVSGLGDDLQSRRRVGADRPARVA